MSCYLCNYRRTHASAAIVGDIAMLETEVAPVLKVPRKDGLGVQDGRRGTGEDGAVTARARSAKT
jgi:hypothetical protein